MSFLSPCYLASEAIQGLNVPTVHGLRCHSIDSDVTRWWDSSWVVLAHGISPQDSLAEKPKDDEKKKDEKKKKKEEKKKDDEEEEELTCPSTFIFV